MSVRDLPKGFEELSPKINEVIQVNICGDWVKCDFVGITRWGNAVVVLHDKSVIPLNGLHEVREHKCVRVE